jgi:hypothetical protein
MRAKFSMAGAHVEANNCTLGFATRPTPERDGPPKESENLAGSEFRYRGGN